ncbi:MAG: DUF4921 family protein [Planctomycetota bacterium]
MDHPTMIAGDTSTATDLSSVLTTKIEAAPATLEPDTDDGTRQARQCPLTGSWTLFAPERNERPMEFIESRERKRSDLDCPFCAGNEDQTPPELWRDTASDDESWNVRVVPNKYPAVGGVCRNDSPADPRSILVDRGVGGAHEVIIEGNRHVESIAEMKATEVEAIFKAYQARLRYHAELARSGQSNTAYVSIFKNVGCDAGASLSHSHSQLVATDFVPTAVENVRNRMLKYRAKTGCCLLCDTIREEYANRSRVIARDAHTIAYCPHASEHAMQVRITSRQHHGGLEDLDPVALRSVAFMVHRVIGWLDQIRPSVAYNYVIRNRPFDKVDASDAFHWSLDILPRTSKMAGYELGTGCMINPVLPETAARMYRHQAAKEDFRRVGEDPLNV